MQRCVDDCGQRILGREVCGGWRCRRQHTVSSAATMMHERWLEQGPFHTITVNTCHVLNSSIPTPVCAEKWDFSIRCTHFWKVNFETFRVGLLDCSLINRLKLHNVFWVILFSYRPTGSVYLHAVLVVWHHVGTWHSIWNDRKWHKGENYSWTQCHEISLHSFTEKYEMTWCKTKHNAPFYNGKTVLFLSISY